MKARLENPGAQVVAVRGAAAGGPRAFSLLFLAALAIRVLHVLALRGEPLFEYPVGDGRAYLAWADAQRAGAASTEVWYQAPLYPLLLAAWRGLAGEGRLALALLQSLLGATSCVVLALAGRRALGGLGGLLAGWLLALYPPAVFHDGLVQKASLTLLLVCAALWLAGRAPREARARLGLGAVVGLWILTRGEARLPGLLLGAGVLWSVNAPRLPAALQLGAGLLAVLLPALARNQLVAGEWVVATAQGGPNLYIGNGPGATGSYVPLVPGAGDARLEREDARRLAEAHEGRSLDAAQVSSSFTRRTLSAITAEPARWLALLGTKLRLTLHNTELVDTEDQREVARGSPMLRGLDRLHGWGTLLGLSALGLALGAAGLRELRPALGVLGGQLVALLLFYVTARYRLPLVPPLCLLGAAGLERGARALQGRDRRTLARGLLVAGLAIAVAYWPARNPVLDPRGHAATHWANVAVVHLERGDAGAARVAAERALAAQPEHFDARIQLGLAHGRAGDHLRAAEAFGAALERVPTSRRTAQQLSAAWLRAGRFDRAQAVAVPLFEQDPLDTSSLELAATALARLGDLTTLARLLRLRVEAVPEDQAARDQLRAMEGL